MLLIGWLVLIVAGGSAVTALGMSAFQSFAVGVAAGSLYSGLSVLLSRRRDLWDEEPLDEIAIAREARNRE